MYTVNHKYVFNLFDDGDSGHCYVTMKPRMPEAGSDSLPVFEIWGGVLDKENMVDMFMTIISNETVSIASRHSKTELMFVDGKLEWQ